MPRRGQPLQPRQSAWCFLGIHRWDFISRHQRIRGVMYEVTYGRCCREGCTRYPTWQRVDVSPIGH